MVITVMFMQMDLIVGLFWSPVDSNSGCFPTGPAVPGGSPSVSNSDIAVISVALSGSSVWSQSGSLEKFFNRFQVQLLVESATRQLTITLNLPLVVPLNP
jgi:hypothetical protein